MELNNVLIGFILTLFAGLSTGVGSAIGLMAKRTNTKFLSVTLGFSAGVMLYVSFVEIFKKAKDVLTASIGNVPGTWLTVISFFCGIFLVALIDKLVPSYENPHEVRTVEDLHSTASAAMGRPLYRMGVMTALAIGIHNFPEGLVTFTAALKDPALGLSIAVAVAIHNIPEGLAVSVPVFYATGSRKKAFIYSFSSGLAEPVGALIGYLLLLQFFSEVLFGVIFAIVAGIMVFISLDELLPSAERYGEHHLCIYGLISGMMVMALSLLLFLR